MHWFLFVIASLGAYQSTIKLIILKDDWGMVIKEMVNELFDNVSIILLFTYCMWRQIPTLWNKAIALSFTLPHNVSNLYLILF